MRFKQGYGKLLLYVKLATKEERIWVFTTLLAWFGDGILSWGLFVDKGWTCWESKNGTICNLDFGFDWPMALAPGAVTASITFALCGALMSASGCILLGISLLPSLCLRPEAFYVFRALIFVGALYFLIFALMVHVIVQERISWEFTKLRSHYAIGLLMFLIGWVMIAAATTADLIGCVIPYVCQNESDRYIYLWLKKHYLYHYDRLMVQKYRIIDSDVNIDELEKLD